MKIVQLIDSLKRGGGAESLVYTFAKAAKSAGIDCSIVTLRKSDAQMHEELTGEGIAIHEFPARKLIDPVRFGRIVRCVRAMNPDVVHTHLSGATILGVASAHLTKKPAVVSLHNVKHANEQHLYHGKLEGWLLRHWTQAIIAVGDRTAKAHAAAVGKTPLHVIPNAVRKPQPLAQGQVADIRDTLFPQYNGSVIATVGSLTEQKGYANLLHSLARVSLQYRCMIIGEGPLKDDLMQLSRSLGIENKVKFLGLRSDVSDLLTSSDVYVSSSLWEGLPVATLEAMYTGLPVISTAVGDAELILRDNCGVLVEVNDIDRMASEITRLLGDQQLRHQLGYKAFTRVDSDYNSESWMRQLKAVYAAATA